MDYAVIMAGGAGTRLWPLSRKKMPKPGLALYSEQSMFQIAVERLDPVFLPEQIVVVARYDHAEFLQAQYPAIPKENYILEPMGKDTAAAIGLAAIHLSKRDPNARMAVLTADHAIGDPETFRQAIRAALEVARDDYLVTLGIKPVFPSTDYGYIEAGEPLGQIREFKIFLAKRFVEKPDRDRAEAMLATKKFSWNSGMFIWKVSRILEEFALQMPELSNVLTQVGEAIGRPEYNAVLQPLWEGLTRQSIDYGVMEGAKKVAVIPVDMDWEDIGNFNSLQNHLPSDAAGNSFRGDVLLQDCKNSIVLSAGKRLVSLIGMEDLVVVDTPDALLVCPRDKIGELRKLVATLESQGREDLV